MAARLPEGLVRQNRDRLHPASVWRDKTEFERASGHECAPLAERGRASLFLDFAGAEAQVRRSDRPIVRSVHCAWRARTHPIRQRIGLFAMAVQGIVTLAIFTCQSPDALSAQTGNQWLGEFMVALETPNPLFLANVTMPAAHHRRQPTGRSQRKAARRRRGKSRPDARVSP